MPNRWNLKAGDVIVCDLLNIQKPNLWWMVFDVDLQDQRIEVRCVLSNRRYDMRVIRFYELEGLMEMGHLKIIHNDDYTKEDK